jgi:hypothetical protein
MFMTKLQMSASLLALVGLAAAGGSALVHDVLANGTGDSPVAVPDTLQSSLVARSPEVQTILDTYRSFLPDDKDLTIFQHDWAPVLKAAKERAAEEKRPIFALIVTNSFGNLYTGHC